MSLTADVKAELVAVRDPRPTARVAELTSLLRFSGGLHSIANRVAVEAELDSDVLARRVARELVELYGVRPELAHVQSSAGRAGGHVAVRVIDGGETLARQTGLLDQRRRPVRGLPNKLTTGSREDLAAVWRGAFLASGSLSEPGRSASLEVACPSSEAAMANQRKLIPSYVSHTDASACPLPPCPLPLLAEDGNGSKPGDDFLPASERVARSQVESLEGAALGVCCDCCWYCCCCSHFGRRVAIQQASSRRQHNVRVLHRHGTRECRRARGITVVVRSLCAHRRRC